MQTARVMYDSHDNAECLIQVESKLNELYMLSLFICYTLDIANMFKAS